MKLTQFRRIVLEDFPKESQDVVSKLAFIINNAFEIFTAQLSKGLTIEDNFNQQLSEITVTVDSNGKPKNTTQIKYSLPTTCKGAIVIQAINQTNSQIYPTSCPFVSFTQNQNNLLEIRHISGLQANQEYKLRINFIGG